MGETITTRFDLGQRVWTIFRDTAALELPCRFCRGKPLAVEGAGGETAYVDCPQCRGRRVLRIAAVPQWKLYGREGLTIGQVRLEVTRSPGAPDRGFGGDNHAPMEGREERYMCAETGVGSGSLYDVDKLFTSLEGAVEELERRNEAIELGHGWVPSYHEDRAAVSFLEHRDVYEHEPEHVELAQRIVAAYEKAQRA